MNNTKVRTQHQTQKTQNKTTWLNDRIDAWMNGEVFHAIRPMSQLVSSEGKTLTACISYKKNHSLLSEIDTIINWQSRNFIGGMYNSWGTGILLVTPTVLLEELQDIYSVNRRDRMVNVNKETIISHQNYSYYHDSEIRIQNLHSLLLCSSKPVQSFLACALALYNPSSQAILYWLEKQVIEAEPILIGKIALIQLKTTNY